MPTLFFPDHDSLRLALASGVVPASVARSPAVAGFDPQGHLWLTLDTPLPRDAAVALARFGVQTLGSSAATHTESVTCWHQLLPLQPLRTAPTRGIIILEVRATQFARLAAEVRRLTRRPIAFRWVDDDVALLRVTDPPFLTLARALDRSDLAAPRAFVEQTPRVWVPLGWSHPLARQIHPAEGRTLFIRPPFGWLILDDTPFTEERDTISLTGRASPWRDVPCPDRVAVRPKLVASPHDTAPELWVLDGDPLPRLEDLVRTLDERILARLAFAVTSAPTPAVVLRVRPGKGPPPVLALDAPGYAPYLKLANLFLPVGTALRPAPRRDAIRHLFTRDRRRLTWLRRNRDGGYAIETISENAFRPLVESFEYRVEEPPRPLSGWKPCESFALEHFAQVAEPPPFPVEELLPPPDPPAAEEERRRGVLERLREVFAGLWAKAPQPPPTPRPRRERAALDVDRALQEVLRRPEDKKVASDDRPAESQRRRQALEAKILAGLGATDPRDRAGDWRELAALYRRADNHADAALCWLNALWDQERPSPHDAFAWLYSESKSVRGGELDSARREDADVPLSRWLSQPPTPAQARSVAAFAVWAALENPSSPRLAADLDAVQSYLDRHEHWLPVRAAWLARSALARVARGDVLGLARARDRVVGRMHESGLGLDLDVPSFLRFSSQGVSERFRKVRDWLKRLRDPIKRWLAEQATGRSAQRTPTGVDVTVSRPASRVSEFGLDPELVFTPAYVDLILAWGLSRLGEHNAGRDLVRQASRVLANGDPVHELLLDAYRYRVLQVQEGKSPRGPLPPELLRRVANLRPGAEGRHDPRYVVDKLRQHSRVLEPSERTDAYRNPSRYAGSPPDVRAALAGLQDVTDSRELNDQVEALLSGATRGGESPTLPAVLLGVLSVASRLGESVLVPALREVIAAAEMLRGATTARVRLLEQATFVAVQLGQPAVVRDLLAGFATLLDGQHGLAALKGFEPLTGESFRGLRRLGLRDECEKLLHRMETWVLGGHDLKELRERQPREWPVALRTLLHVAAGWLFCGQDDRAKAALDEARDQLLTGGELPAAEQTALALTYAATLGHADPRIALGRLEELFQRLRNVQLHGTTNSHYMLKPLELVETVVRSVVNDSFTLGPAVRRWLDDDEFLIRQRIDRDVRAMLEGEP